MTYSQTDQLSDLSIPAGTPLRLITIGASAGGLQALSAILADFPASFPAAILIVQHLSPSFPSQIARILSKRTSLNVQEATPGDRLTAGQVYIAPPDKHLLVSPDLSLSLSSAPKVRYCRPSVDVLFRSAATNFGAGTIGVVLTGGDGDGSVGIQAIKAAGGVTLAQDLPSSQQPSMPRNASATGDIDFVLPLSEIAAALIALVSGEKVSDPGAGPAKPIAAETPPSDQKASDAAAVELAVCGEALRVAEEALRVEEDLILSYLLVLKTKNERLSVPPLSPSKSL